VTTLLTKRIGQRKPMEMIDHRDGSRMFWASILCMLGALLMAVLLWGCGGQAQRQQEELNHEFKTAIDATTKQTDDQQNQIDGNGNNISTMSQKFVDIQTDIDTKIETKIQKEQHAFQKSMSAKFENFKGTYLSKQTNSTNSIWYGIGLVIVCLGFVYLVIMRFTRARHNPGSTARNFLNPLSRNS